MLHGRISGLLETQCSLTYGPLTLKCSLSWTQNQQSSGLNKFGGRLQTRLRVMKHISGAPSYELLAASKLLLIREVLDFVLNE